MIKLMLFLAAVNSAASPTEPVRLPTLDAAQRLTEDRLRAERGQPVGYAVPREIAARGLERGAARGGQWQQQEDGRWQWELEISAPGASSIDVGFDEFWLPQGAELWFMDAAGEVLRGPWTHADNRPHRQLWTPVVPGDAALIRLVVDAPMRDFVSLNLHQVNQGYRFYNAPMVAKALSCNVDVACPEATPYRDQARAAAMYTSGSGGGICSGSLINNTARDATPYFLTAEHCNVGPSDAASLVFYFNYESEFCRSGDESGQRLPRSIADTLTGSTVVAANEASDFLLLRLDEIPPANMNVFYTGWDRRDIAPSMGAAIHHPQTDEKRIAIESDPIVDSATSTSFGGGPNLAPFTYWEVLEWDVGVTEGGSSGSPLLNQDMRIVGQLAGGAFFSCPGAEEGSDVFGKLSVSWDQGNSTDSRLAEWLDPLVTGVAVLDGDESCEAPQLSLQVPAVVDAGQIVDLTPVVSGGTPPYTFEWHLDADQSVDSTLPELQASFPSGGQFDIAVRVADSTGCPVESRSAVVVRAPSVAVTEVAEPVESCGDGDGRIEQGETWHFDVTLSNAGDAVARDAMAGFATSANAAGAAGAAKRTGGPDAFGYRFHDSDEAFCKFDPVDIVSEANRVIPDDDDDGGVSINLGSNGFQLYEQTVTALAMSTNGYLSTDTGESGADHSNDCPLPRAPNTGGGARLMPLHDDLEVSGGLYHQFFAECPRPADLGGGEQGCDVFQWHQVDYFSGGGSPFGFQALLYEGSDEVVFQYPAGDAKRGTSSTTALQNAAADIALSYACNTADALPVDGAVCYYHPQSLPPPKDDRIRLLTPAAELGDLQPGESATVAVEVFIERDFACGHFFAIDYLGAAYRGGFSATGADAALVATIADGDCSGAGSCDNVANGVQPREGFWLDGARPGNGMDLHFRNGVYGAWYTATGEREPIWYYLQTLDGQQLADSQIDASILQFRGPVGLAEMPPQFEVVGRARFGFVDPSRGLMTWELDGERFGQLLTFFDLDDAVVDPDITDQWFNLDESGWGFGMHHQGAEEFTAIYFYDTDDHPAWVVSLDSTLLAAQGVTPLGAFVTHCPSCVWTTPLGIEVGSFSRTFSTPDSGAVDIQVESETFRLLWQREGLPIRPIRSIIEP